MEKEKPTFIGLVIAILIIVFVILGFALFSQNNSTNKAYELIDAHRMEFKDPTSVKILSGDYDEQLDVLCCVISAKNGFGASVSKSYFIFNDIMYEINPTLDEYGMRNYKKSLERDDIDVNKINKLLEEF